MSLTLKRLRFPRHSVGFRELVDGSRVIDTPVSVNFDMREESETSGNEAILFSDIIEAPGHRASMNVLTRQRLCEAFEVEPGELIDILSWAMENPSEPVMIESGKAPVLDNSMVEPDLLGLSLIHI